MIPREPGDIVMMSSTEFIELFQRPGIGGVMALQHLYAKVQELVTIVNALRHMAHRQEEEPRRVGIKSATVEGYCGLLQCGIEELEGFPQYKPNLTPEGVIRCGRYSPAMLAYVMCYGQDHAGFTAEQCLELMNFNHHRALQIVAAEHNQIHNEQVAMIRGKILDALGLDNDS